MQSIAIRMAALLPICLLSACLLTPGKFTSSLDIRADRTYTFAYQGEVIATDFGDDLAKMKSDPETDGQGADQNSAYYSEIAQTKGAGATKEEFGDQADAKLKAIAEALSQEQGYRSVKYLGNKKFLIDYSISSRLDHGFVFPFNVDAQAVLPFIAIELRKDGRVRIQAPGFANSSDKTGGIGGGGGDAAANALNGTFTLTTDAQIVSQNQEEGAIATPRGQQVIWKVTPLTKVAPMATLRFLDEKSGPNR